jgi:hypothetical protein
MIKFCHDVGFNRHARHEPLFFFCHGGFRFLRDNRTAIIGFLFRFVLLLCKANQRNPRTYPFCFVPRGNADRPTDRPVKTDLTGQQKHWSGSPIFL